MSSALRSDTGRNESLRWSIYAGVYLYVCGTVVAYLLSDVLSLLAEVIGVPASAAMPLLATPALVGGAIAWWAVVERRGSRAYLLAGLSGALTALATWTVWTARFLSVWGSEMLAATGVQYLVGFVLVFSLVAGAVTGLPLMYARRRSGTESSV